MTNGISNIPARRPGENNSNIVKNQKGATNFTNSH